MIQYFNTPAKMLSSLYRWESLSQSHFGDNIHVFNVNDKVLTHTGTVLSLHIFVMRCGSTRSVKKVSDLIFFCQT